MNGYTQQLSPITAYALYTIRDIQSIEHLKLLGEAEELINSI